MRQNLVGRVLHERYRVLRLITKGGSGHVYEAENVSLQSRVAIKALHPEETPSQEAIERFHREAFIIGQLSHPCVVKAFDRGETQDGFSWIAMEYLEGETLAARLQQKRFFSVRELALFMRPVCEILEEAHQRGIIHRDLNANNILLLPQPGQGLLPRVLDFGMAGLKDVSRLTDPRQVSGTPCYMSPEQWQSLSLADARSDIYSLGVLCFEALSGRLPFEASSPIGWLKAHQSQQALSLSEAMPASIISEELEACVMKALAKNPDERYQSAMAFYWALDAAISATESKRTAPDLATANTAPALYVTPSLLASDPPQAVTVPAIPSKIGRGLMSSSPELPSLPVHTGGQKRSEWVLLFFGIFAALSFFLLVSTLLPEQKPIEQSTPSVLPPTPLLTQSQPASIQASIQAPLQHTSPTSEPASHVIASELKQTGKTKEPPKTAPATPKEEEKTTIVTPQTPTSVPVEKPLTEEFIKGTMAPSWMSPTTQPKP
jgi:serine/threonine protein kinase